MNKFLSSMKGALSAIAGYFRSGKAERTFTAIAALVPKAYPVVKLIASLTPTGIDDELVALFGRFALPGVEAYLALPMEERGAALIHVATQILGKEPEAKEAPTYVLRAAIENAYAGFRAETPNQ